MEEGGAHASGPDSLFRKLSGRSPQGHKTCLFLGARLRGAERRGQKPFPDMGFPLRLLLLLLLLVQTCIPGRGWVPSACAGNWV